jgi:hypothetical protein
VDPGLYDFENRVAYEWIYVLTQLVLWFFATVVPLFVAIRTPTAVAIGKQGTVSRASIANASDADLKACLVNPDELERFESFVSLVSLSESCARFCRFFDENHLFYNPKIIYK